MISLSRSQLHGLRELSLWAVRRRSRVRVVGRSMEPTLSDGDYVLVDSGAVAAVGDIVLAVHPNEQGRRIIKRVAATVTGDRVELRSDNSMAGTDSRTWGPLKCSKILGVVTLQVKHTLSDDKNLAQPSRRR